MARISATKIRAYARTMIAGLRTIKEVEIDYRIAVYVELIASANWTIDMVEVDYLEAVKKELGIVEE